MVDWYQHIFLFFRQFSVVNPLIFISLWDSKIFKLLNYANEKLQEYFQRITLFLHNGIHDFWKYLASYRHLWSLSKRWILFVDYAFLDFAFCMNCSLNITNYLTEIFAERETEGTYQQVAFGGVIFFRWNRYLSGSKLNRVSC